MVGIEHRNTLNQERYRERIEDTTHSGNIVITEMKVFEIPITHSIGVLHSITNHERKSKE